MIQYHKKTFRSTSGSNPGDVNEETIFIYRQEGKVVTASYAGGNVLTGHLMAIADENGHLSAKYHHVTVDHEIKTGVCITIPEISPDGKLILHEKWQWTGEHTGSGESSLEEI